MALVSPGVEVTIIDQSQYLPAPINSVPLVIVATAQNKANPTGTGVAQGTTAANAGKLFQMTSQRDLVTFYGNPFFYTSSNGTPIQGYELNEYGLLAAYSLLGVTNRCYVLRADIDLASLVGKTGRPSGAPPNGSFWLDTTNSTWGIYEWNATTSKFTQKTPTVITSAADLDGNAPAAAIGNIGDYAIIAIPNYTYPNSLSEKTYYYKGYNNVWVSVGSEEWLNGIPTIVSTASNPGLVPGNFTITANEVSATITISSGNTVSNVAANINNLGWPYLRAAVVSGRLSIYYSRVGIAEEPYYLTISSSTVGLLTSLGIPAGTYYAPTAFYGTASQAPLWSSSQTIPRPNGSVWIKTGAAGGGSNFVLSQYNSTLARWVAKDVVVSTSDWALNASLDAAGGKNIPANSVYAQQNYNIGGTSYRFYGTSPTYFWKRLATGPTVVTGSEVNPSFANGPYVLRVQVSVPSTSTLSTLYTVNLADNTDATDFVTAWSAANIPYTTASVTTSGSIQLTHTEGGVIILNDVIYDNTDPNYGKSNGLIMEAGFEIGVTTGVKYGVPALIGFDDIPQASTSGSGTNFILNSVLIGYGYYDFDGSSFQNSGSGYAVGQTITLSGTNLGGQSPANDLVLKVTAVGGSGEVQGVTFVSGEAVELYTTQLSNWVEFVYDANEGAPVAEPPNNTNWFYSVADQVDILVNYAGDWKGYRNVNYDANGFPSATGTNATDPNGPIVSPSEPTTQSDGTALVYGDIWIDTSDLEQYPIIRRWQNLNLEDQWVLIDNTDQTSSSGVLFADARWATNGSVSVTDDPIPTIKSLLTSNYLDLDCPDSNLYPNGMLLFNTRRSGYNVKQYKANYFNATNFPDQTLPAEAATWVTASGNMENGAPYMGRKAQRIMVVESLRSVIDTNTDIRDEDNFFNLMATPNYPELQPNMVILNANRGETGYILGDTPMGLPDDATAIQAWATNQAGATTTGEEGCVTRNTYLGLFYPSGLASDLSGNLVAVPSSHMMLRTFLRNDTIAYPWFAAAGTRRGVIDNATNIGYLNRSTGEFQTIKTRIGIRDVLYINFINPLVFFTGNGLLNYGNKTSFDSQSALDRTNVARLIAFIRRQLTIAARPFVFEPNDALTRQQIAGVVETLMIDLVAKRGIYDYLVVCDESNNTPARIDRNELWVDVAIEPVKAAEFIYIPVRILNTGELASI